MDPTKTQSALIEFRPTHKEEVRTDLVQRGITWEFSFNHIPEKSLASISGPIEIINELKKQKPNWLISISFQDSGSKAI